MGEQPGHFHEPRNPLCPKTERERDEARAECADLQAKLQAAEQRDFEDVMELIGLNTREVMRFLSKSQKHAHTLFNATKEKNRETAFGHLLDCIRKAEGLVQVPQLTRFQMERGERGRKTKDQLQRTSNNLVECRALLARYREALEGIKSGDHYNASSNLGAKNIATAALARTASEYPEAASGEFTARPGIFYYHHHSTSCSRCGEWKDRTGWLSGLVQGLFVAT